MCLFVALQMSCDPDHTGPALVVVDDDMHFHNSLTEYAKSGRSMAKKLALAASERNAVAPAGSVPTKLQHRPCTR